mgnify:CR=1 FL=1
MAAFKAEVAAEAPNVATRVSSQRMRSAAFKTSFAGHESGRLVASGQLREGEWKVSFGGHADRGAGGSFRGSWQAQLHSVSVAALEPIDELLDGTRLIASGLERRY